MLLDLHEVIRALIYQHGHVSGADVDVRFEAPTRAWIERLTRPTISLFLFRLEENTDRRQTSPQTVKANGHASRRLPPRRIDLHFLVSALATEIEDEHALLWRTLAALMRIPEYPDSLLSDTLRRLDVPINARVAQPDSEQRLLDIWNALGTDPHPAFSYVLTVPLDLELAIEAPLVLTRTIRLASIADESNPETNVHIGGVVRQPDGTPMGGVSVWLDEHAEKSITDPAGRFVLRGVQSGSVTVHLTPPEGSTETVTLVVPSDHYEITLTDAARRGKER